MRKVLFCIYTLALISLISCEKSTDDPITKTSFVINKESESDFKDGIKFDCNTTIKIVKFSTNKDWKVTTDNSSWISVSPDEGEAGDVELYITVYNNENFKSREDTVTIISDDITKIIKITQNQKNDLKVYQDKYELDADGGLITVDIYSTVKYNIEIPKIYENWISGIIEPAPSVSNLLTFSTHSFHIEKNESYESREAEISIQSDIITRTIKIKQHGQIVKTATL